MSDRKTIVVDIVSDSKKFLSGFEEAIKTIEKTAKKTAFVLTSAWNCDIIHDE